MDADAQSRYTSKMQKIGKKTIAKTDPRFASHKRILAFLEKPLVNNIVLVEPEESDQHAHFEIEENGARRYVRGLCRVLESAFFARGRQKTTAHETEEGEPPADVIGTTSQGAAASRCKTRGRRHGTLVHHQVEHMVMNYIKRGAYFDPSELHSMGLDACALKVISYLQSNFLMPIKVEHKVYDRLLDVATAVDLVAVDIKRMELVFIELKTTASLKKEFHTEEYTKPMRRALSSVVDSPYHRAGVQALMTYLISDHKPDRYEILFVGPGTDRALQYPLPHWCWGPSETNENSQNIYNSMMRFLKERPEKFAPLPKKRRASTSRSEQARKRKKPATEPAE